MTRPHLREYLALGGTCAVLTGNPTGLGRRVALRLAAAGARVVVACDDRAAGEETVREIVRRGGEARFIHVSGNTAEHARRGLQACEAVYGRVDILVNHQGPRVYVQAAARRMIDAVTGGSIVDIGTVADWHPSGSPMSEDGSHAALAVMTRDLAISRYELCLATTDDDITADTPAPAAQRAISSALSRYVERGDMATAAVCLASRAAAGVAGATMLF
jgi:NAD(P)-dependent dehydrogenase (short-subunit alcohol dehydrogenase family)